MCTAASDLNINSACLFSIILEEAQNKKLIQRSETIRDLADVDGDKNSQYRSWDTDYVEWKEKMFWRREPADRKITVKMANLQDHRLPRVADQVHEFF